MKTIVLAGLLAGALAVGAAAGLTPRPMPIYDHLPARAHAVLGPVATLSEQRPKGVAWAAHHARSLAADAKARYGRRADALITLGHEPLPNGEGAKSTAVAVRWTYSKNAQ